MLSVPSETCAANTIAVVALAQESRIAAAGELIVSRQIDHDDLGRLLACLNDEGSSHSWRNFRPDGTPQELIAWENALRPTHIFFAYLKDGAQIRLVAACAVAEKLNRDLPELGICVLGRCYIMPQFRGRGFYRRLLQFRLQFCREHFGSTLNAVHIGTDNDRVAKVLTNHAHVDWSGCMHLGEEALQVLSGTRMVSAYLLLTPNYLQNLRDELLGENAPASLSRVREELSGACAGARCNFAAAVSGMLTDERARSWFAGREPCGFKDLVLFCRAIPIFGLQAGESTDESPTVNYGSGRL